MHGDEMVNVVLKNALSRIAESWSIVDARYIAAQALKAAERLEALPDKECVSGTTSSPWSVASSR
jgi:hypothetical protein